MSVLRVYCDRISRSVHVNFTPILWYNFTFFTCHFSTYAMIEIHIPHMSVLCLCRYRFSQTTHVCLHLCRDRFSHSIMSVLRISRNRISHSAHVSFTPFLWCNFTLRTCQFCTYAVIEFRIPQCHFCAYPVIVFDIPHMSVLRLCHDKISHSEYVGFAPMLWYNFTIRTCQCSGYAVMEFHIPYMSVLLLYCDTILHSAHVSFAPILW